MYPWPSGEFDNVMDVALEIAMDYLDRTDQTVMFREVQATAATAIAAAWKVGLRHRIKLADVAIKAVERRTELLNQTKCG
jgi:NADH:ubiquinone oxidoreductase subunit